MLELYISDLDGTLLNSEQRISKYTRESVNRLIDKGMNFTIATARSIVSAQHLLEPLDLKIPVVLMNGIFIYDPVEKKKIFSNYLPAKIAYYLIEQYEKMDISPWVFAVDDEGNEKIFYKEVTNYCQKKFIEERVKRGDKRFVSINSFPDFTNMKIIHINTVDKGLKLDNLYDLFSHNNDIACHYYEDIYYKGFYVLETMNSNATKEKGIEFLKDYLNAEKIICFGDNLNDMTMFDIAEEGYAVENAHYLLKKKADGIIESNDNDGVAHFLNNKFKTY